MCGEEDASKEKKKLKKNIPEDSVVCMTRVSVSERLLGHDRSVVPQGIGVGMTRAVVTRQGHGLCLRLLVVGRQDHSQGSATGCSSTVGSSSCPALPTELGKSPGE